MKEYKKGQEVHVFMPFSTKLIGTIEFYIREKSWEWPKETKGVICCVIDDTCEVMMPDDRIYIVDKKYIRFES